LADIVPLPSAAARPVEQQPRRGRLPKSVGSLRDASCRRYQAEVKARDAAILRGFASERMRQEEARGVKQTIELLQSLLGRALRGELDGVLIAARHSDGDEDLFGTGIYRADPAQAVNAGMRVAWRSASLQDNTDDAE
jgi:hypothetical protein